MYDAPLLITLTHVALLGAVATWILHTGRERWLAPLGVAAVAVFSWWWMSGNHYRDAPEWLAIVAVAAYTTGTLVSAWLTKRDRVAPPWQFVAAVIGGMLMSVVGGVLSMLAWAVATSL